MLTIYTYDSFVAEGGIGKLLAKRFREKTGAELKFIAPGDAALAVAQADRDGRSKQGFRGEILVGIDQALFERVRLITKQLPLIWTVYEPDFVRIHF